MSQVLPLMVVDPICHNILSVYLNECEIQNKLPNIECVNKILCIYNSTPDHSKSIDLFKDVSKLDIFREFELLQVINSEEFIDYMVNSTAQNFVTRIEELFVKYKHAARRHGLAEQEQEIADFTIEQFIALRYGVPIAEICDQQFGIVRIFESLDHTEDKLDREKYEKIKQLSGIDFLAYVYKKEFPSLNIPHNEKHQELHEKLFTLYIYEYKTVEFLQDKMRNDPTTVIEQLYAEMLLKYAEEQGWLKSRITEQQGSSAHPVKFSSVPTVRRIKYK